MKIRYRAQALADIESIYHYLEQRNVTGARNVLRAIYAGTHLIAEQPSICHRTDDADIRVLVVRRYRYKIFFTLVGSDVIEIIHVRHTSRRPWGSDN